MSSLFDFDLSSTGNFGSDFAKGFQIPFKFIGNLGGTAAGGLFQGITGTDSGKVLLIAGGGLLLYLLLKR